MACALYEESNVPRAPRSIPTTQQAWNDIITISSARTSWVVWIKIKTVVSPLQHIPCWSRDGNTLLFEEAHWRVERDEVPQQSKDHTTSYRRWFRNHSKIPKKTYLVLPNQYISQCGISFFNIALLIARCRICLQLTQYDLAKLPCASTILCSGTPAIFPTRRYFACTYDEAIPYHWVTSKTCVSL